MMTDGWNSLNPNEQELAAGVFSAIAMAEELLERPQDPASHPLSAGAVFALANDPTHELDERTRAALIERPRLAELLNGLIRDDAMVAFPRAAAAADGTMLDRRLADGFRIRLVPSRSTVGQTYVIIDLPLGQARTAGILFIVRPDAMPWKFQLPQPMHGLVQLLAENDSPLVVGLADPETEVFLR